jgi:hypothetical protein
MVHSFPALIDEKDTHDGLEYSPCNIAPVHCGFLGLRALALAALALAGDFTLPPLRPMRLRYSRNSRFTASGRRRNK